MPELFKRRENIVDEWITATNKDSFDMVKQLAAEEHLLVGPSSGSVMASMLKVAKKLEDGDGGGLLVGIFADDGRKFKSLYMQQNVFTEDEYEKALKDARKLSSLEYNIISITAK
jgi:cysteine synthase B